MKKNLIIITFFTVAMFGFNISSLCAKDKDEKYKGDITSVIAGVGLSGGGVQGDVTLDVNFSGNGTANTASRSDHTHSEFTSYCQVLVAESGGDFNNIQDAINSLDPSPEIPCTVLVADGTFAQSITINKNHVHLKGSGLEKTFLQPDPTNQNVAITLDGVNDVKITGFTISDSHDYGIESTNSTFVVEQNLFVENSTAIKLTASRSSIKDNMFDGGYRGEGSISIISSQAVISENIFEGEATVINDFMGGYGPSIVTIADNNFTDVDPAIDNAANCASCVTRIVRNIITANVLIDRGISNSGPAVISENTIEKCALSAIHNSSDEAVIANNLLRNCGTNNGAINGCAISNFGTSTITGNSILNNPGHGVQIIRGIATVNGNTIKDNGGYGVSSVGTASIMGNTFINNGLGCINQNNGIVAAANLCESSFSVLGTITAEEDLNVHAYKDMSITAGKNMIISAGENIPITSGKNIPVVAGENMLINAGKDISVVAGENINSEAAVSTAIGSSKDTTIQSGGGTLIESKDITLQASDDITIESLEGTIRLKGTVIP